MCFSIKISYVLALFFLINPCISQHRYSFGTDYLFYYGYNEGCNSCRPINTLFGFSMSKEISLRSYFSVGGYYYFTKIREESLTNTNRHYFEVPLSIKTYTKITYTKTRYLVINGVGVNVILKESKYRPPSHVVGISENNRKIKLNGLNVFTGLGFEHNITGSFFVSLNGIIKMFCFTHHAENRGTYISFVPALNAGIFVGLK